MIYFCIFFENNEVKAFFRKSTDSLKSDLKLILHEVSQKCMSANADSVEFKFACNVHVWAYLEKLPVSGKNIF